MQTLTDLSYDCAQELVRRVAHFEVLLDAKLEGEFNQIERVPHDLVGKKAGVLGKQLHAAFHDSTVVHFVNRADHGLQKEEEPLELGVFEGAASFQAELEPLQHTDDSLQLRLILLHVLV